MISSRKNRKLAEPWFAINKSIYDDILDVALADVLTSSTVVMASSSDVVTSSLVLMTSSDSTTSSDAAMMTSTSAPAPATTNCSELLKLLNDNEDVKPGELPKHHVTAPTTNEFTAIKNGNASPIFDSASASSRHEINNINWNNSKAKDDHGTTRARGYGPRLEGPELHRVSVSGGNTQFPRIHSPSRDCFPISRLNRRATLSRNKNSTSSLSSNSIRMHPKSKRSKFYQEINSSNHIQPNSQLLSSAKFEMSEVVEGCNRAVKSVYRPEQRHPEPSYIKYPRRTLILSASKETTGKEQNEKKRSNTRRHVHLEERGKRNNTRIVEESAPTKGGSKVFSIVSATQSIEPTDHRTGNASSSFTDTKKIEDCNDEEIECYPLDLTVGNLVESSAGVLIPDTRDLEELQIVRKPEITYEKNTKEKTIVGRTHVDLPSEPTKVCWTKVEKDTLLKVVERLSITCLADDAEIETSHLVETNNSDISRYLTHSDKEQTPLSVVSSISLKQPAHMSASAHDVKPNLIKRTSYDVDSETTPTMNVKLRANSYDSHTSDECVTSLTTVLKVKTAQNNDDILRLSPSIGNIYEKSSPGFSPVKDGKLVEVRTSRKRVHFNELQPCATSEEHSRGINKRSHVLTNQDRSPSSKLSRRIERCVHEDHAYPDNYDSTFPENHDSAFTENHESPFPDSKRVPLKDDNKDSVIERVQQDPLRNHSDFVQKIRHPSTCENVYDEDPSDTYENAQEDSNHHRVSCQTLFSLESYPNNTLRDHCLNSHQTDYKNLDEDSKQENAHVRTNRNGTKRNNNSNIHQRVVIRVEDAGKVSQQFWAAVDKTIVSNMVDQILTSAVNCNSHSGGDERFIFERRDHVSVTDGPAMRRMNYYGSAEAVWQHFHDFNDSQQVSRTLSASVRSAARRNGISGEEDTYRDVDDDTCEVIEPGLCIVDAEEGQGDSGSVEGHSTFKWKSNILKRVRIDQIMTSPVPISDWRRSPNVASPVAV